MLKKISDKHRLTENIQKNWVLSNAVFALVYCLFCFFGFWLSSKNGNLTPIWAASGLAVAAVFVGGRTLLPGIFVGAVISNALTGIGILAAFGIASGSLLEASVALWLLKQARNHAELLNDYALGAWIVSSALIAPIISAFLGIFAECYLSSHATEIWRADLWRVWWASSAVGIMLVTPCLLFSRRPDKISISWGLRICAFLIISLVVYTLFFRFQGQHTILYLALPLLLLACAWFGQAGCAISTLLIAGVAYFIQLYLGDGPTQISRQVEEVILLDIFLGVLGFTSLALSIFYRKNRLFVPGLILISGWAVSAWLYHSLHSASQKVDEISFNELITDSESSILNRYNNYVDALRASAAFYIESDSISRREWRNFTNYLGLDRRYPGINGLGIVLPLKTSELEAYVARVQETELPDFYIRSSADAEPKAPDRLGYAYYIVDRIEPVENNPNTLGMDLSNVDSRQAAAKAARDSGQPTLSENIQIASNEMDQAGFLLFMPMYSRSNELETIDERRDAFLGWAYAPFIANAFYEGILQQKVRKLDFAVFDQGQINQQNLVYQTDPSWELLKSFDYESLTHLEMGDRRYSIAWKRGVNFNRSEVYSASIAAASLALGTCFLAGIVISLLTTSQSANRIVEIRTAELRNVNETLREEVLERKQAEENADSARRTAEAANLAKSEFLATMSHEIRTPMNSVLGFSELLNASPLNTEQKTWTSYILGSGQSLLAIINDILDFSKIEAGKMELERTAFSVKRAAEEVSDNFCQNAHQKGINIDFKETPTIPERVMGDPIRFKQVVTNLVANAIKFTEKGLISVSIDWKGDEKTGTAILIVADTGVGIEADKLETLFQKFTQVDSSTTRKFGGTGLGLAISKTLIELMQGSIIIESRIHEGTTVMVQIPFEAASETDTGKRKKNTTPPIKSAATKYKAEVLLVDDNMVNRKLGVAILQRLGCKTTLASDGKEAVDLVKTTPFSIVFMDCRMPVLDGFDATRQIRQLEKEGLSTSDQADKPVPILALTANVTDDNKDECIESGMNDLLRKPCKITDFSKALETYCNHTKESEADSA